MQYRLFEKEREVGLLQGSRFRARLGYVET